MQLNGAPEEFWPTLEHGDIESRDLKEIGEFLSKVFTALGIESDPSIERWIRGMIGAPEPEESKNLDPLRTSGVPRPGSPGNEDGTIMPDQVTTVDPRSALNGIQIKELRETLFAIGADEIPPELGEEFIVTAFQMPRVIAKKLVSQASRAKRSEPDK